MVSSRIVRTVKLVAVAGDGVLKNQHPLQGSS